MPYRSDLTEVARKLRRNMTDVEHLLWSKLRRRQIGGACFYRQRIIDSNIADFYCRAAALVIELDGGQHFHGEVKEKDTLRDSFFEKRGLRVLRFGNHEVLKDAEAVLAVIFKAVTKG